MYKPRKIYLLKTEHFDLLFSEPSCETAKFIADNADRLYDLAKDSLPDAHDFRIPVIISPDSDRLSVDYTSSPYNRIVIFDGVPESDDLVFQNSLAGLFYHEIYLALSQSIRDPFNQFIYKTVGGDSYQPISLAYLPFSFVEGRAFIEEGPDLFDDEQFETDEQSETDGQFEADEQSETDEQFEADEHAKNTCLYGHFCDKDFLNILSIAKYENKFPNWIQAGSARDIYPGRLLNEAAGSAFSAYLMHTYGVEKYVEFWNECGKVNLNLTSGMFKKVYGRYLSDLWKDFKDSVPLPNNIEKIKELETKTKNLLPGDSESVASNLLISDYGIIWYDDIRHEVDIIDWNSTLIMRRLLFLASDVKKLSLSPDGRYLIVSFYGVKARPEFRNDKVWIYDLHEREFIDLGLNLRDGVILSSSEEGETDNSVFSSQKSLAAGISVKDKKSRIQIYNFEYDGKSSDLVCEKDFSTNEYPCNLTFAGKGKLSYLVYKNNKSTFCQYDFENNIEKRWNIIYKGKPLNIKNLRRLQVKNSNKKDNSDIKNKNIYTFEYYLPDEPSFVRMGIILLNEKFEPCEVYFQDCDVAGGIRYPVILADSIIFCSNKFNHNKIQYMPVDCLPFIKGGIEKDTVYENQPELSEATELATINDKKLGDYDLYNYNPLKYMMHISFVPFMAIKDLATTKEQKLWPSLGGTFITQYDPFMNNRIMLSGSAGYAKLDFTTIINPTIDDVNEKKGKDIDDDKKFSFGVSVENTSTPVDIRAGCLFKFNQNGEYNFSVNTNAFAQIPFGMAFSKLNLSVLGNYTASTDYYDRNLSNHFPSLSNWPKFEDSYETGKITISAEYSNIHQYGISKYEERGLSLGIKFDTFWDITEIKILKEKIDKLQDELKKEESSTLTKAQINMLRDERMLQVSQIILSAFGEIKIPKLLPLNIMDGFILSLPSTIKAELFNEAGTAVDTSAEILLLGYECQNGLPFLYLYFSRLGLKFGYNLKLKYDTFKVPLPDIREKDNLWNVFSNTYVRDSIYFIYNMDFCAAIGRLSEYHLNLSMKAEYFLRSKGFAFSLNFLVTF